MSNRVVITGLGAVTPIGIGTDEFWQGMIAGKNGISEITAFDTSSYPHRRGGQIKDFDPAVFLEPEQIERIGRASQLAIVASKMAMGDAGITHLSNPRRVGVSLGTTYGEPGILEQEDDLWITGGPQSIGSCVALKNSSYLPAINVAVEFGVEGMVETLLNACAAGNCAIGYAFDQIKMGCLDVVIAGGAEGMSRVGLAGFNRLFAVAPEICQPFDKNRKGMMLSEGAGVLVMERLEHAVARRASIYAEVAGYGVSCDAYHITGPHPRGIGAIRAMESALAESKITLDQVDYINAHGTGTPANDKVESLAIKEVFKDRAQQIPVSSIKSMLGHSMGAASAIEAVASALVIKRGVIPPTINYQDPDPECDLDYVPNTSREQPVNTVISNALAFGGNCAVLALRKFDNRVN